MHRGISKMSDNKDVLLSFVLGGLVGAALGVLYAPKSGRETRSNIKKFGEDIVDTVSNLSDDFKENESQFYGKGCEKVSSKDRE
jgi:gas vesicle protein